MDGSRLGAGLAGGGALGLALTVLSGCGSDYPTPFTSADMAKDGSGAALAHYLHQPGATAAVCDPNNRGPRFRGSHADDFAPLTGALVDGDLRPDLFQRCAMLLLEGAQPAASAALLDEMAHAYRDLLGRGAIESDRGEQVKLAALHKTFLLRRGGTAPHPEAIADDLMALRKALDGGALGPVASRNGRELLVAIDLERGLWKGKPITGATLDDLERKKEEDVLRRIALRSPDTRIRKEARRRIVRLHIATSPSREVRAHAEDVEARVVDSGQNAVDVTKTPPEKAWLDDARARVKGVYVRQDIWKQTATLLAFDGDQPGASLLPSVDLRGALFLRIDGYKDPITLCAPPDALDVTPCLSPAALKPKVPIVYVDDKGLLHFVERVTSKDAMRLVYNTPNLPLPFEVAGKEVVVIEWPVVFERPADLVFSGNPGGRGPDLQVVLERRYSPRLFFDVKAPAGQFVGVVEPADIGALLIATRGGPGAAGSPGTQGAAGSSGSAGMSASCPGTPGGNGGPGGRGGNGTNGGAGGPGGPAGKVLVRVACSTGECDVVASRAAKIVRSEGGPGGSGGPGGRGGPGGPGGPGGIGTSCMDYATKRSTYLSGGTTGMRGADGSPGANGSPGMRGADGTVRVEVAR